jgi:uncharacterized protein (DUF885 family)
MRIFCLLILIVFYSCQSGTQSVKTGNSDELARFFESYSEERLVLFPIEATTRGDKRYNHLLQIEFTDGFRDSLRKFYSRWLSGLNRFEKQQLSEHDRISHQIFRYEMETQLEGLDFPSHLIPFHQFWGLQLDLGQLGSANGSQPFKTSEDYKNWTARAARFSAWADSAIVYFRKGMKAGIVLPRTLVLKMIPQMQALSMADPGKNVFYGPIHKMPPGLEKDSALVARELKQVLHFHVFPAYGRLAGFLEQEYLPKARATSGISSLGNGQKWYNYLVRFWTTSDLPADSIYKTGLSEVHRIREEMERVKNSADFRGSLHDFFEFMKNDRRFMPYKNAEEVLEAYSSIQQKIDPHLGSMFTRFPKTRFEIRQTEAFRAASASAEYQQGTADGSRPGIFYVPIIDPASYNITSGMESLFLHEAIPGHHFQIALQQENEALPRFRRYAWYGAFGEGWALYCESLGKELGLYSDPYQYMGALGDEMHRAIRLVVDVGIHLKGMSREAAIQYMMENEAITLEGATAEIERYMAIPGQALSYKMGSLKIMQLRKQYEEKMGEKFSLSWFHDEIIKDGVMPINILEAKMNSKAGIMR